MTTPHEPEPERENQTLRDASHDRVLNPGEIVTVIAASEEHVDTPPNQAFVVIDGFNHPLYVIAALGGDGYQWPNQPREWLKTLSPSQLRQHRTEADEVIYVVD